MSKVKYNVDNNLFRTLSRWLSKNRALVRLEPAGERATLSARFPSRLWWRLAAPSYRTTLAPAVFRLYRLRHSTLAPTAISFRRSSKVSNCNSRVNGSIKKYIWNVRWSGCRKCIPTPRQTITTWSRTCRACAVLSLYDEPVCVASWRRTDTQIVHIHSTHETGRASRIPYGDYVHNIQISCVHDNNCECR